jgi:hypothetical protein
MPTPIRARPPADMVAATRPINNHSPLNNGCRTAPFWECTCSGNATEKGLQHGLSEPVGALPSVSPPHSISHAARRDCPRAGPRAPTLRPRSSSPESELPSEDPLTCRTWRALVALTSEKRMSGLRTTASCCGRDLGGGRGGWGSGGGERREGWAQKFVWQARAAWLAMWTQPSCFNRLRAAHCVWWCRQAAAQPGAPHNRGRPHSGRAPHS